MGIGSTRDQVRRAIGQNWIAVLVIVTLTLAASAGCTTGKPKGPIDLTILHTADVGGYIDPCG